MIFRCSVVKLEQGEQLLLRVGGRQTAQVVEPSFEEGDGFHGAKLVQQLLPQRNVRSVRFGHVRLVSPDSRLDVLGHGRALEKQDAPQQWLIFGDLVYREFCRNFEVV